HGQPLPSAFRSTRDTSGETGTLRHTVRLQETSPSGVPENDTPPADEPEWGNECRRRLLGLPSLPGPGPVAARGRRKGDTRGERTKLPSAGSLLPPRPDVDRRTGRSLAALRSLDPGASTSPEAPRLGFRPSAHSNRSRRDDISLLVHDLATFGSYS